MASSSSGSGLTFKLHPLVIVNISDHHTRVRAQIQHSASASAAPLAEGVGGRVFGCVIGVQRGRTVEIFNSFELLYDPLTHSLDRSFLEKKQELYKKVFPNFYILGWYSTGSEAQESDLQIHKATVEAERISVDHVAHLKPSDGGSAATQCDIPLDNSFLRQVSSLLRRLPAMESEKFQDDFLMEYNDTLLVAYLAMLTNCSSVELAFC
ncbi:COP9 signalosome complex subunit [Musa troglodytarum]|uniref:COP9 signalosome complex subunit n=1 Tax=Musa troglodytarum TaxID=320322 RepID=A0A9E7K1X9_9LILI|nr:COP9 signalosome complex subunit [Musa troglodytarum]